MPKETSLLLEPSPIAEKVLQLSQELSDQRKEAKTQAKEYRIEIKRIEKEIEDLLNEEKNKP